MVDVRQVIPLSTLQSEYRELRTQPINWCFLIGNRLLVSGCIVLVIIVLLYAFMLSGLISLRYVNALYFLFSALVTGNATLIALVVSINQLVLSQQLLSPGEFQEQIESAREYREGALGDAEIDVIPVAPTDFLKTLFQSTRRDVQRLGGLVVTTNSEVTRKEVDGFVTDLTEHIDDVIAHLEQSNVRPFSTLTVTLLTNYAEWIHDGQQLQANCGDELSEDATEMLDHSITRLQRLDIARQYFKTIYTQTELAYLSRVLLYAGIVSELILVVMLLVLTGTHSGASLPASLPMLVIPLVTGIGFAPLVVLAVFVVRLAVITQHTAAITPFATSQQDRL